MIHCLPVRSLPAPRSKLSRHISGGVKAFTKAIDGEQSDVSTGKTNKRMCWENKLL